jgi:DNA-binding CsgD family transcriptional regulator
MAGLSFQSEKRTYCFDGALPQRQLSSLIAHFRKAVELRFAFDKISRKALLGQKLVDRINAPVLIVNGQAEVLYANASGEAWLANSGSFATKEAAGFFRKQLVLEVVKQLFAQSHAVAMSSPPNGADGCASVLVGLPITRAHALGQHEDEPLGMLVVHEPGRGHTNGAAIFGQLYGLTRAEQRLLVTWACHGSVRAAAEELNVSVETVRTQIKSVLAKTGCDRQIDLAKLVSQLGLLM